MATRCVACGGLAFSGAGFALPGIRTRRAFPGTLVFATTILVRSGRLLLLLLLLFILFHLLTGCALALASRFLGSIVDVLILAHLLTVLAMHLRKLIHRKCGGIVISLVHVTKMLHRLVDPHGMHFRAKCALGHGGSWLKSGDRVINKLFSSDFKTTHAVAFAECCFAPPVTCFATAQSRLLLRDLFTSLHFFGNFLLLLFCLLHLLYFTFRFALCLCSSFLLFSFDLFVFMCLYRLFL